MCDLVITTCLLHCTASLKKRVVCTKKEMLAVREQEQEGTTNTTIRDSNAPQVLLTVVKKTILLERLIEQLVKNVNEERKR